MTGDDARGTPYGGPSVVGPFLLFCVLPMQLTVSPAEFESIICPHPQESTVVLSAGMRRALLRGMVTTLHQCGLPSGVTVVITGDETAERSAAHRAAIGEAGTPLGTALRRIRRQIGRLAAAGRSRHRPHVRARWQAQLSAALPSTDQWRETIGVVVGHVCPMGDTTPAAWAESFVRTHGCSLAFELQRSETMETAPWVQACWARLEQPVSSWAVAQPTQAFAADVTPSSGQEAAAALRASSRGGGGGQLRAPTVGTLVMPYREALALWLHLAPALAQDGAPPVGRLRLSPLGERTHPGRQQRTSSLDVLETDIVRLLHDGPAGQSAVRDLVATQGWITVRWLGAEQIPSTRAFSIVLFHALERAGPAFCSPAWLRPYLSWTDPGDAEIRVRAIRLLGLGREAPTVEATAATGPDVVAGYDVPR